MDRIYLQSKFQGKKAKNPTLSEHPSSDQVPNLVVLTKFQAISHYEPDMQIFGTLKMKFQIYRFLSIPSNNIRSVLVFRVAIYLQIAMLAELWQPGK